MTQHLPFPVAFPYDLIDTGKTPADRHKLLLRAYESLVRYCAAVQLSDYLANGCPDTEVNKLLLDQIGKNFSLGHWIELTRRITKLQKKGVFTPFMPEMAAFYFKPGRSTDFTVEGRIFDSTLVSQRNIEAHGGAVPTEDQVQKKFVEIKDLLDTVVRALGFLGRYTLYVPTRTQRKELMTEAMILMGPRERPSYRYDLRVPLSARVAENLDEGSTAFLCDPTDPGRQLLLCPLSLFAAPQGAKDIFLIESCKRRKVLEHLYYRGVGVGEELTISAGSSYEPLVELFRKALTALEGGPPAGGEPAAPRADVPRHYFEAQKKIIRDRVAGFVGRERIERDIDGFVRESPCGYFVIEGDPGQGKTAVACRQIVARTAPHHLIKADRATHCDPRLILGSLLEQLGQRLTPVDIPEGLTERTKLFEDVLARVAAGGERVLVVIDGLDELPAASGDYLPFLPTDTLPDGVFFVVTSRPGARLEHLRAAVIGIPSRFERLPPLDLAEITAVLRSRRPEFTDAEVERVAVQCQGNPLYLVAVCEALAKDRAFDLTKLPRDVDGFFRKWTQPLRRAEDPTGRDVLGLLTVAQKPLSVRELAQVADRRIFDIEDQGIAPVRQFLVENKEGFEFYHTKFREFVLREFFREDELPDYHRMLADWLGKPPNGNTDYRWQSLAHHLFEADRHEELLRAIDQRFLGEKARRFGYAVLDDVELLAKTMIAGDDPAVVERCVRMVEGLRAAVGGDVIGEARRAVQPFHPGPAGFRSRVIEPAVPTVPGVDLYVGMLPKIEVGADFFEVIPLGDRLVLVLGDAPGAGLKPAFLARFLGNLIRRHVEQDSGRDLVGVIAGANQAIAGSEFFDPVSVQVAEIDPRAGRLRIVNAGIPFPVVASARRGKADALPVYGETIQGVPPGDAPPRWEQRRAEIEPGDVFVMVTDGLTEAWRPQSDAYRDRFVRHLTGGGRTAREIGQAILDDWRSFPRDRDYSDDVTVIVAVVNR